MWKIKIPSVHIKVLSLKQALATQIFSILSSLKFHSYFISQYTDAYNTNW